MTSDAFITAVQAMEGVPPEMKERLVAMSSQLTDARRDEVLSKLSVENDAIVANRKEAIQIAEEGEAELKKFSRTQLPKLRGMQEKSESDEAMQKVEDKFKNAA